MYFNNNNNNNKLYIIKCTHNRARDKVYCTCQLYRF